MNRPQRYPLRHVLPACLALLSAASGQAQPRPNVVFILMDDMGWKDLGHAGSTFYETPSIDRLASQGMRFTAAYAAGNVCSPTRSAILTGKTPARTRNTNWFGAGTVKKGVTSAPYLGRMPSSEVTLAEAFRDAGYVTGFVGKWHLGPDSLGPTQQGFASNIGGGDMGHPKSYFPPYGNPHLIDGPGGEYLTDRLTQEALSFLERNRAKPFFLYLSHYAVHTPLQAKPALAQKYRNKAAGLDSIGPRFAMDGEYRVRQFHDHPEYAAMVESVDQGVGRILAKLAQLGLDSNTLVVFTSDNGGLSTAQGWPTSNAPLRGGKGWLYEGGIRVPLLLSWPGKVPAGRLIDTPVVSTDLYPTLLELAGLPLKPAQHRDGRSFAGLATAGSAMPGIPLFWHYPHYSDQGGGPGSAMRSGRYKLIEFFDPYRVELYDLKTDSGETRNLLQSRPQVAAEMVSALRSWRTTLNAAMPPDFLLPVGTGSMAPGSAGRIRTGKLRNTLGRQVPMERDSKPVFHLWP